MWYWTQRSLTTRLILGLFAILLVGQLSFTYLSTYLTRLNYDRAMMELAAVKFGQQAKAISEDPSVSLPAPTEPGFQRVDLIWRAENNPLTGLSPGGSTAVVSWVEAEFEALGVEALELQAVFAPSTKFDAIEGAGGQRYRGPVPPMETLVAARFPGVDGWITARLRAGPPPPPVTGLDLALNVGVVLVFGLIGIFLVAREMKTSLEDLRSAVERVGPSGLDAEITPSGSAEFQPIFHALNRMTRRVKELVCEKDVMLGAIGHDLRTPLTSLRLILEPMEPEEARSRAIGVIDHAGGVLEDILELARADNVGMPTKRYNIASLIEDDVLDAEERGEDVTLGSAGRVIALCRPESLRRMMENLVGNSVKYAGHARIALREEDGMVVIIVEDDGPGLPEDMLERIFEPFERGDASRNATVGGTGLGLTLARAVARSHGGTLTLSNRAPHGLRAEVRFPAGGQGSSGLGANLPV